MATTTNYGWTTPDDTALVKDGAAAIRTLGSSVDTSVKALSPGTTAGDLDYYTTSTAKARLGIGTAGQVLTVNGGGTAPSWATSASGGMTLISTTTLTGASITLSSIPATYNDLRVVVRNFLPATDSVEFDYRFNADATASRHQTIETFGGAGTTTFSRSYAKAAETVDNTVGTNLIVIDFPDYANTTSWKLAYTYAVTVDPTTTTSFKPFLSMSAYNQTAAISSLSFLPGSGNFTSGTVLLYGVK